MTAAAVAGVAAWIGMIVYWRSESGVTAFAIGAVIGRVGMMAGARGGKSAWLAAFLTLASVAGGRIGGAYWWVNYGMGQHPDLAAEVPATRESYEATKRMAKEWTELATPRSDEAVVGFMLEHGATQAAAAAEVSPAELEHFREEVGPALESLHHADLTMDQYLEYVVGKVQRIVREDGLLTSAVAPRLRLSDFATTAWGMGTAWCLVFVSGRRRRRR